MIVPLKREQRDALPDTDFAVPAKRVLPIHDARHVRMAWSQLPRAQGLDTGERQGARAAILLRAQTLGIDLAPRDMQAVSGFTLQAMALDVPEVADHPNRMPFSGILVRLDEPSDKAPHGSNGSRTLISKEVAEAALPSLLGMAIDFKPDLGGHDSKSKIGVITEAWIDGNAIWIAGFLYAHDFPEECARIKREKDALGFSYECRAAISDLEADPWVVTYCVFTGAAVLYKHLAAYTTTSLAAQADEGFPMTAEELKALLAEAIKPITTQVENLAKEVTDIKASATETQKQLEAAGAAHGKVKPHADALRACATNMAAAGIGGHTERGHVTVLNKMADRMEAEAMMGQIPHIHRDHDYLSAAAAGGDGGAGETKTDAATEKRFTDLAASVEATNTLLKDLQAKAFKQAEEPTRKTLAPEVTALLTKFNLSAAAEAGTLTVEQVNKTLDAAPHLSNAQRIETKLKLMAAGVLPATGTAASA